MKNDGPATPHCPVPRRALLLVAGITLTVLTPRTLGDRPINADIFAKRLAALEEDAQAGRWQRVHRDADDLLDQLEQRLMAGGEADPEADEAAARALSLTLSLRALGASARGEERDALWDWSLAQSLWPPLRGARLSAYGEPARLLAEHPMRPVPERSGSDTDEGEQMVRTDQGMEYQKPPANRCTDFRPLVKVHTPPPAYPSGSKWSRTEGAVILNVVIDTAGLPGRPVIVDSPGAPLSYAAAEALRTWRFEPVLCNGEPQAAFYNLKVNFRLQSS